jgi:cytochrome c556
VGRSPYQSEKRRKELARLKKQEEKRQRRFNKKHDGEKNSAEEPETISDVSQPSDSSAPSQEVQEPPETHVPEGEEKTEQGS